LMDQPVVEVWVSQVGRKSFVFKYRMIDENTGRLFAEGCSTQVWYDYRTGTSQVVPEEIIRAIAAKQQVPLERAP